MNDLMVKMGEVKRDEICLLMIEWWGLRGIIE